jgi:type I restriction enzyme S subunit
VSGPWQKVRLGEVLKRIERFEPRHELTEYQFAGTYSFARGIFVGERKLGSTFALPKVQRIHAGDFVYCKIMAWEGAFGLVPADANGCVMSGAFVVYEINQDRLDQNFLNFFFKIPANWRAIGSQSTGTNIRRRSLHPSQFEVAQMPLPPLAEQRRIVARIEELAAKIAEARSLRQQGSGGMGVLFEQARAKIFEQAGTQGYVSLQDIATLERGKFSHRPRNDPRFFGGAHPWIQIAEIGSSGKFIRKYSETLNEEGLAISKKFAKGTVLVSIAATIGVTGILDFDCCVPDSIVGVTPRGKTDSEFLYHFLGYVRAHLERIAPQSAQKNINLQILSPLLAPKLTLVEQRRIVTYLDGLQTRMDALKNLQAETTAELDALLPSVLDKAFKGEL